MCFIFLSLLFFFKQKTAYEMRISDWSSDVCSSDLFDTEGPEDRVIVQAVSRMQRYPCRWWLLPGNHDYARNGGLWDRVRHKASDNIILLTEPVAQRSEEHTSELQSLMRISYAVFCLKKKNKYNT